MAKVLALVTFKVFPPQMGGQKGVAFFYRYLSAHHHVIIAASEGNTDDQLTIQQILSANKRIYLNLFSLPALVRLVRSEKIECIISEHSYTGWIGWFLRKITGIPFIIHSHNIEAGRFRLMNRSWWKKYLRYEKWISGKADHNFFISREDQQYAIDKFKLQVEQCSVIPYGIDSPGKILNASARLRKELRVNEDVILLYFNGSLDYYPNQQAVNNIISKVIPELNRFMGDYKIIISGNKAPVWLEKLMRDENHIMYLGYTDWLNLIYQGCDVFINPVVNNSGVKTKVIEALANSCKVVSTESGATGVEKIFCNDHLITAPDDDWLSFTEEIISAIKTSRLNIPEAFLNYYSWENIAQIASEKINEVIKNHA